MQTILEPANSNLAVKNPSNNANFSSKNINTECTLYANEQTYTQSVPRRMFTTPLLPSQHLPELPSLNTTYSNFTNLPLNGATPGLPCISYFPQPSPEIPPYFTPSIQSSSPTPSLLSDAHSPNSLSSSEIHHSETLSDEECMPLIVRNYSNEFTIESQDPVIPFPASARVLDFTSWLDSAAEPETFPECTNFEKYARELFSAETKLGATEESLLCSLKSYQDHFASYVNDVASIQFKFDKLILQVVSIYHRRSATSKIAPPLKPFDIMVRTLGEKFCKLREATLQHHLSSAEISFSNVDTLDVPHMEVEARLSSAGDVNQGPICFDDAFQYSYIPSDPNTILTDKFSHTTMPGIHESEPKSVREDNSDHSTTSLVNNVESSSSTGLNVPRSHPRTPSPPPRKKKRTGSTDGGTPNSAPNYTTRRVYFSKSSTLVLKRWLDDHHEDPYPDAKQKQEMAAITGLTYDQVQHWFINARMRIWRPMLRKQKEAAERQLLCQSGNSGCTRAMESLAIPTSALQFQHLLLGNSNVPTSPTALTSPDADLTPQQWHKKIRDEHLKVDVNSIQGLNSKPKAPRKSQSLGVARPRATRQRKQRG